MENEDKIRQQIQEAFRQIEQAKLDVKEVLVPENIADEWIKSVKNFAPKKEQQMQAKIYAVPVGVINGQMVTTIEVYVPDLLLVVNPANSTVFETADDAEEKYSELEALKEFEVEPLHEPMLTELSDLIKKENEIEDKIFTVLDKTIRDAVNEFKMAPKIQIASAGDLSMLNSSFGEDDDDEDDERRIIF